MFGTQFTTTVDYFQGVSIGGGKLTPILEPEHVPFYKVRAAPNLDMAISTVQSEWYVQRKTDEQMNASYNTKVVVMILFILSDSQNLF